MVCVHQSTSATIKWFVSQHFSVYFQHPYDEMFATSYRIRLPIYLAKVHNKRPIRFHFRQKNDYFGRNIVFENNKNIKKMISRFFVLVG